MVVPDTAWNALIAGGVTVVLAWMTQRYAVKAAKRAEEAARRVEEVKAALEKTTGETKTALTGIADVGNKTHTLVNSAMGIQLKLMLSLLADWLNSPRARLTLMLPMQRSRY